MQDTEGLPPTHGPSERRQPKLPYFVLGNHVRNLDFIGRKEAIQTLTEVLVPLEDKKLPEKLRAIAVTGIGSMGKTSLGVEFALRFQDSLDAIFLVQATSEDYLAQGYAGIAFKLGLIGQVDAANKVVGRNVLLQWLNNATKADKFNNEARADASRAKWLLIFDNADKPDVLEDFWPTEGIGYVIVTSRNPNAGRARFYSIQSLKLDPIATEDATKMLFRITDFTETNQSYGEAHKLASRLDGFPLALQQISCYVRRTEMGFAEALSLLNDDATARRLLSSLELLGHTLATV
ncbi:P-loop containing nucleoside triphosphate hydrolase protein [Lophiotrema nucula]|uniref:P-loop containing nucleoside triphosphate hydrolase protein n=1 Tax=Lophiotrema nucula TaxID=690887 RepID=A0A6A5YW50_9PLEO|nr:P-loop containing nucleoside triphosphate hydrolase protein [Lophiotrema nucula]